MFIVNFTLLTTYTVIYCFLLKILQASSDSCHISRSTVQIVEDCPKSKEQWKQAAARKNCAAHASQCSEPEKLEYHCVINPFINQTLEVCAYAQNIVLDRDCYDLTKKAALVTVERKSTIKVPTAIYPASSLSTKRDFSGNEGRIFIILFVLLVALTMTLVVLQLFYIYHRVRENNRRPTAYTVKRDVSNNLMEES